MQFETASFNEENYMIEDKSNIVRDTVFISKATPGDDEFVLWLAPRLEAAGYKVFADILTLEPGGRWRKRSPIPFTTGQLKCCCVAGIPPWRRRVFRRKLKSEFDLAKRLVDPTFVIPLRLEPYKKLFGIGELHYIDFVRGWAEGLSKLLETLKRQKVLRDK